MFFIFVFKQKTAYEMRISDWSSDVCSSDLIAAVISDAVVDNDDLVERGYLKSVPQNPTGTEVAVLVPGSLVPMELGNNAEKVCEAVAKQTGGSILADPAPTAPAAPSGCFGVAPHRQRAASGQGATIRGEL